MGVGPGHTNFDLGVAKGIFAFSSVFLIFNLLSMSQVFGMQINVFTAALQFQITHILFRITHLC